MDNSIEERVFAFVEQETCTQRESLTAQTTLSDDIGLDGLPAVEFFNAFRWEFKVDLERLQLYWDDYFVSEEMPLTTGLLIAMVSVCLGVLLVYFFPRVPAWCWYVLAFGIWLAFMRCLQQWRHKRRVPQVAIQDLIDSVQFGKWVKEPPVRVS
jgi:hypothetical protein